MPTDEYWRTSPGIYAGLKDRKELGGIIEGILADDVINVGEVVYLATWLRQSTNDVGSPFIGLLDQLDDVLADGRVDAREESELRAALEGAASLCYSKDSSAFETGLGDELVGYIKGLTSDRAINDVELSRLQELLDVCVESPLTAPVRRLVAQYSDDRPLLLRSLTAIAGHDPDCGVVRGLSVGEIFDDPIDPSRIGFPNRAFCFTGTFHFGTRSRCAERVYELGGDFHKHMRHATNYLVVGTIATRAWCSTTYGRKIEDALVARQKKGFENFSIISESAWNAAAERLESGRSTVFDVDPDQYFSGWTYTPNNAQRAAFGVRRRERIDSKETTKAREKARKERLTTKEVSKIRVTTRRWTATHPPEYDFHVGDLFHTFDEKTSVQVADDTDELEVHSNQCGHWAPYRLTSGDLAHWLRTGVEPAQYRIPTSQCGKEIHRFLLAAEERELRSKSDG